MKPDSWMAFYWPKFQTSTSHMRREYKWSYFTAICRYYWDDCKGLPTDDQELMLICECYDLTNWAITKGYIFGEKFKLENGKWHQDEARKIYNEAKTMMENNLKRVEAAIAANPNHKKHRNDNRGNQQYESSQSSSPESLRNPPIPLHIPIPIPIQLQESFCAFWNEYPKKKAKADAIKAFPKAIEKIGIEQIISAVKKQKTWDDWKKEGGKFIPLPASWLNGERWLDEITKPITQPVGGNF